MTCWDAPPDEVDGSWSSDDAGLASIAGGLGLLTLATWPILRAFATGRSPEEIAFKRQVIQGLGNRPEGSAVVAASPALPRQGAQMADEGTRTRPPRSEGTVPLANMQINDVTATAEGIEPMTDEPHLALVPTVLIGAAEVLEVYGWKRPRTIFRVQPGGPRPGTTALQQACDVVFERHSDFK
jgi:hypothetical protein